jgi:predicted PurR-regulated permease PerM
MAYHRPMQSGSSENGMPTHELVPDWLAWLGGIGWRVLATIGLAIVVLWLAIQLSTTTASILIAGIVSATFAPYVVALRRRGWGRAKAAGVVTFGAVLIIVGIVVVIIIAFVPQIASMINALGAGLKKIQEIAADASLPPEYAAMLAKVADEIRNWLSVEAAAIANLAAITVTITILAGLLTFYMLSDGDKALAWAVPDSMGWRRAPIRQAAVDSMQRVGGYLRGSAILGAVYGVTDFVFLLLIGLPVPLAAPLSVLVFMGSFIPYLGGVVTTIILLLVTYGALGSTATLVLFALMAVRNVIVSNFLRPVVYGKTVDLHPAVILMVLPAGAAVAGIFGLFAAIPVTAFLASVSGAVVDVLSEEAPEQRESGPPDGQPRIPVWLDRLGQWSVRLLLAAAMGGVLILVAGAVPMVITTATIGIILAATFRPAVSALERRGWHPGRAALMVTVGAWGVALVVIVVSLASLLEHAPELVDTTTGGATSISDTDWVKTLAGQVGTGLFSTLTTLVQGLAGFAVTMLLGALLMFYLLRDGSKGWAAVTRRFGGWRGETVDIAGQKAVAVLSGYMVSTGALAAFGAISQAIIMWLLGLPLILPIAMLSFILGFIPYIGGAIGTLLAFLVAVKVGTTQDIIVMGIWTIVFNIVQGSFVAPVVYGKAVSLHPAIVLIAIPAGGQLAGIIGMFVAVPILGIVAAIWRLVIGAMSDRRHALALEGALRPPELDHPPDPGGSPEPGPIPAA